MEEEESQSVLPWVQQQVVCEWGIGEMGGLREEELNGVLVVGIVGVVLKGREGRPWVPSPWLSCSYWPTEAARV